MEVEVYAREEDLEIRIDDRDSEEKWSKVIPKLRE